MFIETSAATGEKVEEAFMKTSELIFQRLKTGGGDTGFTTDLKKPGAAEDNECAC